MHGEVWRQLFSTGWRGMSKCEVLFGFPGGKSAVSGERLLVVVVVVGVLSVLQWPVPSKCWRPWWEVVILRMWACCLSAEAERDSVHFVRTKVLSLKSRRLPASQSASVIKGRKVKRADHPPPKRPNSLSIDFERRGIKTPSWGRLSDGSLFM